MGRTTIAVICAMLHSSFWPEQCKADQAQDALFARVLAGTSCKPVPNNGMYCEYKLGDVLEISIKDVGGTDTVIGFRKSNIESEFYAVGYFGCVVVVPGNAHARNYNRDYNVFISPKTGQLYHSREECSGSLQ